MQDHQTNKSSSNLTTGGMLGAGREISTRPEEDFDGRKQELEVWTGDACKNTWFADKGYRHYRNIVDGASKKYNEKDVWDTKLC